MTPGVFVSAPNGYVISNRDPALNSTYNDEIYGPNFQPGFEAGLTNTTIYWHSGNGYANISYSVGPWAHNEANTIPHFAVGSQCCNFKEVPHTQQFTQSEWADHYYSRAGLWSPGVNVENYTAVWGDPTSYVGLRTDRDWTVQFSLDWTPPTMMNPMNEWGAIGIAASQYVQGAPNNLVYTVINFWTDPNSSSSVSPFATRVGHGAGSPDVVVYHPIQIAGSGNQTITLDISPYLEDTIRVLGLRLVESQPPVISYVYLNVEGYNVRWNSTLWSFIVMSPLNSSNSLVSYLALAGVAIGAVAAVVLFLTLRKRSQRRARIPGSI